METPGVNRIVNSILPISYKLPFLRALASRSPIVFLYHSVPRTSGSGGMDETSLEQHILFLKQYCDFVTPQSLGKQRRVLDKIQVVLSFDDGMRNNATVVAPILRRHKVPALFFVCSRHATPGRYLWFTYLRALERHFSGNGFGFRGNLVDMTPGQRPASVRRLSEFLLNLTPHPAAMYQAIVEELPKLEDFVSKAVIAESCAGMTAEQVGELAADPLFSIGIHTVDHPFLTKCNTQDLIQQIQENREWIENTCNHRCDIIAYPSGDYNNDIIECEKRLGIAHGYAVIPIFNWDSCYEIPRIGIYATSLAVLGFKAFWGSHLRSLRVKVG